MNLLTFRAAQSNLSRDYIIAILFSTTPADISPSEFPWDFQELCTTDTCMGL